MPELFTTLYGEYDATGHCYQITVNIPGEVTLEDIGAIARMLHRVPGSPDPGATQTRFVVQPQVRPAAPDPLDPATTIPDLRTWNG